MPKQGADFDKLPDGVQVDDANHCCCNLVQLPQGVVYLSYYVIILAILNVLNLLNVGRGWGGHRNHGYDYYWGWAGLVQLWYIYAGCVSWPYVQKGDGSKLTCAWTGILIVSLLTLNPITIILNYYFRTVVIKVVGKGNS